ncbi:hypothetical protein ACF1FX_26600 [Streptomyces sp. NPDC014646]|uniref:hypothetical protein n=1 Tax=unclassified Streptomyces TaxID=2593676 RepID=UPI0036FEC3AF
MKSRIVRATSSPTIWAYHPELREQATLAVQPGRVELPQTTGVADVDADEFGPCSGGQLGGPVEDSLALHLAGQGGDDPRAASDSRGAPAGGVVAGMFADPLIGQLAQYRDVAWAEEPGLTHSAVLAG